MPSRPIAAICAVLAFAACGQVDYDRLSEGEFRGMLFVMWVGEGGTSGDGRFVYVPYPVDPLRFARKAPDASVAEIRPEMMYTDGGSIPRAAQLFKGLNPWGYAPAYMVHDWLFVARHCLTDGMATPAEQAIAGMGFQESAEVIGEAIKTLIASGKVRPNDVAPRVISGAVAGPVSYDSWVAKGACERVSEDDRKAAAAGLPGGSPASLAGAAKTLPDGTSVPLRPAEIVAAFRF